MGQSMAGATLFTEPAAARYRWALIKPADLFTVIRGMVGQIFNSISPPRVIPKAPQGTRPLMNPDPFPPGFLTSAQPTRPEQRRADYITFQGPCRAAKDRAQTTSAPQHDVTENAGGRAVSQAIGANPIA